MRRPLEPNRPDVELLLAAERQLAYQTDDLCDGAVERARAAIPRTLHARFAGQTQRLRRSRIGLSVAAAVLVFAAFAAAFIAGYRTKTEELPGPVARAFFAPQAFDPAAPTRPSASPLGTNLEPLLQAPRAGRAQLAPRRGSATSGHVDVTEVEVLRPAQQAIARDDFASAFAAIAVHQRQFPAGQLAEEREALRVKALLGLGRMVEARRAGAAFRDRFPHSALLDRIEEMLESQK